MLPGHRCRLHHHQSSSGGRGRFSALPFLQQQQRKPPGHSHRFHKRDQSPAAGNGKDRLFLLHRLRRGPFKGGLSPGRGRGGDHLPLLCRSLLRSGGGLYSGHRRPGHEMHPHQRRNRGQRPAQRSLFLRLRLLHRDLCQILKLQRGGFRKGGAVCPESH